MLIMIHVYHFSSFEIPNEVSLRLKVTGNSKVRVAFFSDSTSTTEVPCISGDTSTTEVP